MTDPLDAALAAAVDRFVETRPQSAALAARAGDVLPGGNTRSVLHTDPFGIRIAHADGAVLTTVDGDTVVDLLGDYSAGLLGRRPEVADAIRTVLDRGWGYGAMSDVEAQFAAALVARFDSVDQIRFTNSGSEADLMAVLTARHVTGRERIVVFEGAYHGGPMTFLPGSEPLRVPFEFVRSPTTTSTPSRRSSRAMARRSRGSSSSRCSAPAAAFPPRRSSSPGCGDCATSTGRC